VYAHRPRSSAVCVVPMLVYSPTRRRAKPSPMSDGARSDAVTRSPCRKPVAVTGTPGRTRSSGLMVVRGMLMAGASGTDMSESSATALSPETV
jgi:hypothetical protein